MKRYSVVINTNHYGPNFSPLSSTRTISNRTNNRNPFSHPPKMMTTTMIPSFVWPRRTTTWRMISKMNCTCRVTLLKPARYTSVTFFSFVGRELALLLEDNASILNADDVPTRYIEGTDSPFSSDPPLVILNRSPRLPPDRSYRNRSNFA